MRRYNTKPAILNPLELKPLQTPRTSTSLSKIEAYVSPRKLEPIKPENNVERLSNSLNTAIHENKRLQFKVDEVTSENNLLKKENRRLKRLISMLRSRLLRGETGIGTDPHKQIFSSIRESILHAIDNDNLQSLYELFEEGLDYNAEDDNGHTMLYFAAIKGKFRILEGLVYQGCDLNHLNKFNRTVLSDIVCHLDQLCSDIDVSDLLMKFDELRADVNKQNQFGETILFDLIKMKESYLSHELLPTVLSNLIKLKVNPKLVDKDGNTMLQRAVIAPNMPCFSLFIENGFDRNLQNEHGVSALMTATSVSSIDVFKYVLAQGINIDLVDEKGKNVVHYLIERTDTNRTTINMMYNELLKHGVNIDQQEKDTGLTPLHKAVIKSDNTDLIYILLKTGAKTTLLDAKQQTAEKVNKNEEVKNYFARNKQESSPRLQDFIIIVELKGYPLGRVCKVVRKENRTLPLIMKQISLYLLNEKPQIDVITSLNHPNILNVHEAFFSVDKKSLFMITDLVEPRSLADIIKQHKLNQTLVPEIFIWRVIYQLLGALQCMLLVKITDVIDLHANNVTHKSIKPENILVSADDMIFKISDFGLSLTPEKSTYVSQTIYSSPEMIFEESFDANTDVWTLGCILYELAELRFLFFGTPALVEKFAKETVQLTKDRYSEMLHTVITKCLTYDSAKRPTSAQLCQSAILQKTIIEQGVVSIADVRSVCQDGDDVLYIEKPQELE